MFAGANNFALRDFKPDSVRRVVRNEAARNKAVDKRLASCRGVIVVKQPAAPGSNAKANATKARRFSWCLADQCRPRIWFGDFGTYREVLSAIKSALARGNWIGAVHRSFLASVNQAVVLGNLVKNRVGAANSLKNQFLTAMHFS